MTQPADELRDVPGYEGRYSVTRDGRIWSHPKAPPPGKQGRKHSGRWMSPILNKRNGLYSVVLSREGQKRRVHVRALAGRVWA